MTERDQAEELLTQWRRKQADDMLHEFRESLGQRSEGMEQEALYRAPGFERLAHFGASFTPANIAKTAYRLAHATGKNMENQINQMTNMYDVALTGRIITEKGIRRVTKEEKDWAGMVAARNVIEMELWWSGIAPEAVGQTGKLIGTTVWKNLKPQIFRILDRVKPKGMTAEQVTTALDKLSQVGAKFTDEEKDLISQGLKEGAKREGVGLPTFIKKAKDVGMVVPREPFPRGKPSFAWEVPAQKYMWRGKMWQEPVYLGAGGVPAERGGKELLPKEGFAGLFAKIGTKLYPIKSWEDASRRWAGATTEIMKTMIPGEYKDMQRGAEIVDRQGNVVANIAWNGNIFPGRAEDWKPDTPMLYNATHYGEGEPQPLGSKAIEQRERERKELSPEEFRKRWKETTPIEKTPEAGERPQIEQVYPKEEKVDIMGKPIAEIPPPPKEPPPPTTPPVGEVPAEQPTPEEAKKIITDALKATKPMRAKLEKEYTAERAKRIKEFEARMKASKGQAGYFEALRAMRGELAEKPFAEAIQDKLTQPVIDQLYEIIKENPKYTWFEKMDISRGLTDILEGKVPQPHMFPLLQDIFGEDFVTALAQSGKDISKLRFWVQQTINLPKTVKASFDLSAPYRQGVFWMLRPSQLRYTAPAFARMFKYAFSEKAYQGLYEKIRNDPTFPRMKRFNIGVTDPSGDIRVSAKEEQYQTDLPEIISNHPFFKYTPLGWAMKGIRMSERAFTGFLNDLRFHPARDLFNDAMKNLGADPGDPNNFRLFNSITSYVNSTTGRGDIGRLGSIGAELNATFWSPRFIKARLDMLNPAYYVKLHPRVRKKLILGWCEVIATGTTIIGLAALVGKKRGASVEADPRSTDFGKIRFGRTRWDIWGGHQQYIRVLAQILAAQRKTSTGEMREIGGKKWPFETRTDVLMRFGKGKLAPIPQLALMVFEGQRIAGGPITPLNEIKKLFIPMVIEDITEAYGEFGPGALFSVGVPATLGVGVQTYEEVKPKTPEADKLLREWKRSQVSEAEKEAKQLLKEWNALNK